MKKLIVIMFIALATSAAQAQHHHRHRQNGNWMAPVIVGGVIGYALTRNYYEPTYNYTYVPLQPAVVQQPVISVCTPWTETQHANGTITRTRTCQ